MRSYVKGGLLASLAFSAAPMLHAQASEGNDQWQFEVTPYLFMTSIVGTTGAGGVSTDVDESFNDVFKNLDAAFMGTFEARKGRWGLIADVIYAKLEKADSASWLEPGDIVKTANIDLTVTENIYQFALAYRVYDTTRVKLDLLGAARYTRLDTEVDLRTSPGVVFPGGDRNVSVNKSWWDPVVGARVIAPFAENWAAVGYADFGGGGGSSSDTTYQAIAGVNWSITETFTAKAGYRYLYQDYTDGGPSQFTWDMALQGAYLGLGIAF